MHALRLLCICLMLAAGAATQAEVSESEIDEFLRSRDLISRSSPYKELNDILRANLPTPGLKSAVIQLTAAREITAAAAALLLEAEIRMHLQGTFQDLKPEDYPPAQVVALVRRAASMQPQVEWPWTLLRELLNRWGACRIDAVTAEFFSRPGAERRFLTRNSRDWYCDNWSAYLVNRPSPSLLAHWRFAESAWSYDGLARAAVSAQLLSAARADRAQREVTIVAARKHWLDLAKVGLSSEVLRQGATLEPTLLEEILDAEGARAVTLDGANIVSQRESRKLALSVRTQWVIALQHSRRGKEARAWLARFKPVLPPTPEEQARLDAQRVRSVEYTLEDDRMLRRLMATDTDADPFDDFVGDGEHGWFFTAARQTPLAALSVAQLFTHNPTISKAMLADVCSMVSVSVMPSRTPQHLSTAAVRERERLERLHADVTRSVYGCTSAKRDARTVRAASGYLEKPLPEVARSSASDSNATPALSSPLLAQLGKFRLVRADLEGAQPVAISVSRAVDPTGEVGEGGYWLHLFDAGNGSWRKPVYLGLQQMQPYIVQRESKLPLLAGDRLQVEVQVRELDGNSLMFPPIGLPIARQQDDVYIERSLAELTLDSDGDGLTDVLEDKLRTNPQSADTDQDGLTDDVDAMPQVSVQALPHPDAEIFSALLQELSSNSPTPLATSIAPQPLVLAQVPRVPLGRDSEPVFVRFLRADPAWFTGMVMPTTVVVLSQEDLVYLTARYGLHFVTDVPSVWFNRARDRGVVRWSTGWSGGVMKFERTATGWKSAVVTSWVT